MNGTSNWGNLCPLPARLLPVEIAKTISQLSSKSRQSRSLKLAKGYAMPISPGGTKYEDKDLDALFKAVGFVVVQWGMAEQSLDMIVAILFQNLGGKSLAKRIPIMLTPKLDFIRQCLKKNHSLHKFQNDGELLISKFEDLSEKRNGLVHGAIATLLPSEGSFRFSKLDVRDGFHHYREFQLDSADFPNLTKDLIDLGSSASNLGHRLLEFAKKEK